MANTDWAFALQVLLLVIVVVVCCFFVVILVCIRLGLVSFWGGGGGGCGFVCVGRGGGVELFLAGLIFVFVSCRWISNWKACSCLQHNNAVVIQSAYTCILVDTSSILICIISRVCLVVVPTIWTCTWLQLWYYGVDSDCGRKAGTHLHADSHAYACVAHRYLCTW